MWQDEASHLNLDQKKSVGRRRRRRGKKKEKREKKERRERSSNFSPRSTEIGGSVFFEPRSKDHLLDKFYVWVPKTRDVVEDSSEEFEKSRVYGLGSVHGTS